MVFLVCKIFVFVLTMFTLVIHTITTFNRPRLLFCTVSSKPPWAPAWRVVSPWPGGHCLPWGVLYHYKFLQCGVILQGSLGHLHHVADIVFRHGILLKMARLLMLLLGASIIPPLNSR